MKWEGFAAVADIPVGFTYFNPLWISLSFEIGEKAVNILFLFPRSKNLYLVNLISTKLRINIFVSVRITCKSPGELTRQDKRASLYMRPTLTGAWSTGRSSVQTHFHNEIIRLWPISHISNVQSTGLYLKTFENSFILSESSSDNRIMWEQGLT